MMVGSRWRFPEMGIPPVIIHFDCWDFPMEINHPANFFRDSQFLGGLGLMSQDWGLVSHHLEISVGQKTNPSSWLGDVMAITGHQSQALSTWQDFL